jgi:predicted tellurium resistance membrane protein TerC
MKFKKFILLYIPYVFLTNIAFSILLRDWKHDMKLFVNLQIATMNLPVIAWIGYFLSQKIIRKSKKKKDV